MEIRKHSVVSFDYTLTGPDGRVIDSSEGRGPLVYLHGSSQIIPGLENALEGKTTGDQLKTTIAAAEAYGEKRQDLVQEVSKNAFRGVNDIKAGMQFQAQGAGGPPRTVTVVSVQNDTVTVDANHPLAGVPLTFDVKITDVREATPEELQHGHAHGPGGHHH